MKKYSEYRALARETLKGRWNEMALLALVISAIGIFFSTPTLIGALAEIRWLTIGGYGCNYVLAFLIAVPLTFAFYNLCLTYARREELEGSYLAALFKEFSKNWGKYVLCFLLMFVIIFLITIPTLMIGAIILGLAYGMVPYIIHDNPEIGVRDALKRSRLMMRGHKWQLFVLQLTFIGWALLCLLTFGIGFLWLTPYQYTAIAHFYDDVKAEYEAQQ